MDVEDYFKLKGINNGVNTKECGNCRFACYFDLFERVKNYINFEIELVIIESNRVQTQVVNISGISYLIVSYYQIQTVDLISNFLYFPNGTSDQINIFESLWNQSYLNSGGEILYYDSIADSEDEFFLKVDCSRALGYMNAPEHMSSNLLSYLKTLNNYKCGFEVYVSFIILHELGHKDESIGDIDFEALMKALAWQDADMDDWADRYLREFSSSFLESSTISETKADLRALLLIDKIYIKTGLIDKRIIPIYLVTLFNSFLFFNFNHENFSTQTIKEIQVRKALCVNLLRNVFGIKGSNKYFNMLCHIDTFMIEEINSIFDAKLRSDPESKFFLTKALTKFKYIPFRYIPHGYDISDTNDVNLVRYWIENLAKELVSYE